MLAIVRHEPVTHDRKGSTMAEETPRGTRSHLGPLADEGMPDESDTPEARQEVVEEATAKTAEDDQTEGGRTLPPKDGEDNSA